METYKSLRQKHKKFIYHDYKIIDRGFYFHFSIDDTLHFYPRWEHSLSVNIDSGFYSYLVFNLGMAELVSYWKCACPETVEIRCGPIDGFQEDWWKKLYKKGLGEFFYKNGIEPGDDFMTIKSLRSDNTRKISDITVSSGCLIPVGGGKDSAVTMELLGVENNLCYMINPRKAAVDTARAAGFSDEKMIVARRTIDSELLRLNREGYLNGHTPFSAVVAFSSYIFACLSGKKYIALSNESSANESNVSGTEINHQYSKSVEFERDFREYTAYLFGEIPEYFSLLRPLNEWRITERFVSYKKYLNIFQSCNVGTKADIWCGKCAKCLYVYIMLSAFLKDGSLIKIFGSDMLSNETLTPIFEGLIYENVDKPFECVGTREEVKYALKNAYKLRVDENEKIPELLLKFINMNRNAVDNAVEQYYDKNNFVPGEFLHLLGAGNER
ncbi:MAG: hypothetical protein LBR74_01365 [Eubacterium sp.]|jgi:hypothetical protein|nr:hypothetical protein [Eubacterium sp.]